MARYRRSLIKGNRSYRPELSMQQALLEVDYWTANIKSFDKMMKYISQRKTRATMQIIIPKNKPTWLEEFDRLVYLGNVLDGKVITAKQTEFSF